MKDVACRTDAIIHWKDRADVWGLAPEMKHDQSVVSADRKRRRRLPHSDRSTEYMRSGQPPYLYPLCRTWSDESVTPERGVLCQPGAKSRVADFLDSILP
jgi:hypothetical protein